MKMKITVIALAVLIAVVFSSCAETREFVPLPSTEPAATTEPATEASTTPPLAEDKFTFAGIQMGMTTDQVQFAIGQSSFIYTRNDKYFFTNGFKGIAGIDKEIEKTVYFIFNMGLALEEIQYVVNNADGITYEQMLALFEKQFGKPVLYTSELGKNEGIWADKDVYIVVTRDDTESTVISYFEKTLFETEYTKEVEAFRKG